MDVDEILRRVSNLSTEDKKEVEKCFECYKQFFLLRYRLAGTNENAINFCDQVMMLLVGKMMGFIRDVPQPVQEWDTKKVLSMSSLSTDMRWMKKLIITISEQFLDYFEQILIF